jgi:hypothetical protein
LVQRIAAIPAPYVLTLAAPRRNVAPPDPRTAKKITADLRGALLRIRPLTMIQSNGYTFIVMADRRTGDLMASPRGMRACFQPPSEIAGEVTARRIAQRAARKVSKYTRLADQYGVSLIVATGAHAFTGVAVGTAVAGGPPHRSPLAELPHGAPASGSGGEARCWEGMHHAGWR